MARLNRTQRRTAKIFTREANRFGASPRERKALFEAGLVEANLTNPRGGDASSVGSLQEQSHYGSVQRRLNRGKAARRFLSEARAINRRGFRGSAGQLAQAVQRSAYPSRYDQRSDEAEAILAHFMDKSSNRRDTQAARSIAQRHVPAVSYEAERRAAAMTYFSQRGRPGALLGLAESLSAIPPDQPGRTVAVPPVAGGRRRRRGRSPGLLRGGGKTIGVPHAGTHTLGNWQSDNAIDVSTPRGTPVYSPASGKVIKVSIRPEGGRISGSSITIQKADGSNAYFFTHLSGVNVRAGQKVKKGQQIGKSGVAVGVPHLHFGQKRGDPRKRKK